MSISSVKLEAGLEPWFDALTLTKKTQLLDFAAVIIFLLKFKVAYLPDYALEYLNTEESADLLYGD